MQKNILVFLFLTIVISDAQALKRVLKRRKLVKNDPIVPEPSQIETPEKSMVTRNHRNGRCKSTFTLGQKSSIYPEIHISKHF